MPNFRRKQPRVPALFAGVCLALLASTAAADDLANRAFQLKHDASGITSLKRTGDVADTDYIAANGALGRLIVRYGTSPHGDWKELRDLMVRPGAAAGQIGYALGTLLPSMSARASGNAVQGVAGIRGLNDGLVPRSAPGGGRGGGPGAPAAADIPIFTWTPSRGVTQWVQYTFPAEETIGRAEVFWTVSPQSWRLLYQDEEQWKEVAPRGPYGRTVNAFSVVEFAPVRTMALRIEVILAPEAAPALAEWRVGPDPSLAQPRDLSVNETFTLQDDVLEWTIVLANEGEVPVEVGDLAVPFTFAERAGARGDIYTKKLIRHSLVAGHGSWIYWQRSNAVGPYLLMTPAGAVKFEYFDSSGGAFTPYVHARAASAASRAAGGNWRLPISGLSLQPKETRTYTFRFHWARDAADVREILVREGKFDTAIAPGMVLPVDLPASISLRSRNVIAAIVPEYPASTKVDAVPQKPGVYSVTFSRLGENLLTVRYGNGQWSTLEFFVTEPLETVIRKRAAFLVSHTSGCTRLESFYPGKVKYLDASGYLERAYRTAIAYWTVPNAVEKWSADAVGTMNEAFIPELIDALEKEGKAEWAKELRGHWEGKVDRFINRPPNLYGSEFAFDSTGFESTGAFARYADTHTMGSVTPEAVKKFTDFQLSLNVADRGWLETTYYQLGSDYRGSLTYLLSYMSQMGGWAILDYGLHFAADATDYLRLGYASSLSSWALVNSGTRESGYGYWFPSANNDGATGGGFMPEPLGRAWIGKQMARGAWYYSAEEDVGYCAAIRTHATVVTRDPALGEIAYGGVLTRDGSTVKVISRDGLRVRFHVIRGDQRFHMELDHDGYAKEQPIVVNDDLSRIQFVLENRTGGAHTTGLSLAGLPAGEYDVAVDGKRAGTVKGASLVGPTFRSSDLSLPVGEPPVVPDLQVGRRGHGEMKQMSNKLRSVILVITASVVTTAGAVQQKSRPAVLKPITPKVAQAAKPLPLNAVRLTGGPLKRAQELDAEYLLKLEPDRMLSFYRTRAGLPKKAEPYGGWDGEGRQLTGHIAGHYLSAVSYMWAATGDPRFKQRADYIVSELKLVQDAHKDGYLGAIMGGEEAFQDVAKGNIKSSGFDLNGLWSPWYTLHKTYAGLRDAYRFTGNRTALDIEQKYAAWAESILLKLDDAQTQQMLNTEFGGMNEVLADLYADTGDRRWLDLSYHFEHRAVMEPLTRHEDNLSGLHGNTTVPKVMGSLARFMYTGDVGDGFAAAFFWDRVAKHHSFATGGHGKDEYFREPDKLSNITDGRTAESCNVYNMLKMTRELFSLRPDIEYAEFHERALFNHILGSIDPNDGSTCYMVPVGQGVRREYANMFQSFTCCVGSGMESHALHGFGLYYASADRLWVNLYAPSTADWAAAGVKLAMDTTFPEGDAATLRITTRVPKAFTIAMRRPRWAGQGFTVKINGSLVPQSLVLGPGSYVELTQTWKTGDTVELTLPKALHLEPLVDNPRRTAIMWGPLVMAGDLGPEPVRAIPRPSGGEGGTQARVQVDVPTLVSASRNPADWLQPIAGKPGSFGTSGVGRDKDVELTPFYRLHRRLYAAYFDIYTPSDWEKKSAEVAAERERVRQLEAATVAYVQPGEMQPERDFNQQGENTTVARVGQRTGRTGRGWFSFDVPVDATRANALVVTYHSDSRRPRSFDIVVDGQQLAQERFEASSDSRFVDREYPLPGAAVQGKQKVTVRFQSNGNGDIAAVFGLRVVRR